MFHPGILRPTSSGEDYWTWRTEDEDPTVDRSVLLCRSEGEIFWHNMNSLDKIAIAMNNNWLSLDPSLTLGLSTWA